MAEMLAVKAADTTITQMVLRTNRIGRRPLA